MQFKDYYATLGVAREASQDEIKQAYRKLARKYHPDVSKEADAEVRFKEIGEANEVLKDPEKRAAYDQAGSEGSARAQDFQPPPGGMRASSSAAAVTKRRLQCRRALSAAATTAISSKRCSAVPRGARSARAGTARHASARQDHHAKVMVALEDAYRGAQRSIVLRLPTLDRTGRAVIHSARST